MLSASDLRPARVARVSGMSMLKVLAGALQQRGRTRLGHAQVLRGLSLRISLLVQARAQLHHQLH
jgi:hypothetical protein